MKSKMLAMKGDGGVIEYVVVRVVCVATGKETQWFSPGSARRATVGFRAGLSLPRINSQHNFPRLGITGSSRVSHASPYENNAPTGFSL